MVFAGKVVGFEYRKGVPNEFMQSKGIDYETKVVKFQVGQWWKGETPREIFLVTDETRNADGTASNSSCNYDFKEGESYLVFAYGKENELRTNSCSRTQPLNKADEYLKILGEGKEPLENNDEPNKSMDVRAKQRLRYQTCPLNFSLRVAGFAPRHLNRSMLFLDSKIRVKRMTFQLFWSLVIVINFCVFNADAQSKKSDKVIFDTCETGKAKLADASVDFQKNAKPDSYLVIIGGAMKGEKSSYNSQRIQQAIPYLDFVGAVKSEQIVFGTGTSEAKAGYLRLYVNGILSIEIRTRKNAKLCWGEGDAFDFKVDSSLKRKNLTTLF